ncbi:MAG: hypothetical protein V3T88_04430 [Nitrosomonadaceae bacterium]
MDYERLKEMSRKKMAGSTKTLARHTDEKAAYEEMEVALDKALTLDQAIDVVLEHILPLAEMEAERDNRSVVSVVSSITRPLYANKIDPSKKGSKGLAEDNRTKKWQVHIRFFDVTQGSDMSRVIADNEGEIILGLKAIGAVIIDYAKELHLDDGYDPGIIPEFTRTHMLKRMVGMHPAISRGAGEATTVIKYSFGDDKYYTCRVDISRT